MVILFQIHHQKLILVAYVQFDYIIEFRYFKKEYFMKLFLLALILLPLLQNDFNIYYLFESNRFKLTVVTDFDNLNYLPNFVLRNLFSILLNWGHGLSFDWKLYFFIEFENLIKFLQKYEQLQNHKIRLTRCLNPNFYFRLFSIKLISFSKTQMDTFENWKYQFLHFFY